MNYARIEPQVLQIEVHPYLTQEALIELAKSYGIAVTAYSSFGPLGYIELNADKGTPSLLEQNVVTNVAKAHGKSGLHVDYFSVFIDQDYFHSSPGPSPPSMGDSARHCCDPEEQQP